MPHGYAGRLLFVDLTNGTLSEETPNDEFYRSTVGGIGLGARVLLDRIKGNVDALGPDNILGFTTGPLTATGVYGGGRFTVVTKSPMTGGWADSNSGGTLGPELRRAGYDGVFFNGVSARPVCLVIDQGKASLVDAEDVWGKDTYETDDALQERLGDAGSWKIACIGTAGEQQSILAGIVNEKGRIAARSGVGAVMGSKKLKALAVRAAKGTRIPVADPAALKEVHQKYAEDIKNSPFHKGLTAAGTGGGTSFLLSIGDCPTTNWAETGTDSLPTTSNLDSAKMDVYKLKPYSCATCSIRCGAIIKVDEGPYATEDEVHRPEYETLAAYGPLCRNDNVEVVIKANEICNRAGIDTISAGTTVAFAIECFEKGLITTADTGGLELTWGNGEAIVELTRQMAVREGFGAVLADGSKKAAERIGKGSEEYAMNVGGRELPLHDPRIAPAQGAIYMTDSQPANHMNYVAAVLLEQGHPLGPDPALASEGSEMFGEWEKKADYYTRGNAYYILLSSAGLCNLYAHFYAPPVVELLGPVTGWDIDWNEGLEIGRRILTMRQLFNVRQGIKPQDFKLPKRFETSLTAGPAAGAPVPPFEQLKADYYVAMGWDPVTGEPSAETLERLGITA